jgi:hypothetical protein
MLARWLDRSIDHVRLPSPLDPSAPFAKDWLHLNLFDHASGTVGLVNASMHGDPSTTTALAVGCALFHHPHAGWCGGVDVQPARSAYVDLAGFGLGSVGFMFREGGGVAVSVARPRIEASPTAQPVERAIIVEDRLPFGPGWISWRALPRLVVEGSLHLLGHEHNLSRFSAYHDHNWGRWRWGDDAGWEWGTFLAEQPGPAFVWSRATNRAHTTGASSLTVRLRGRERRFSGPAFRVERRGCWRVAVLGPTAAVTAMLHAIEILLDGAARIPVLRQLADEFVADGAPTEVPSAVEGQGRPTEHEILGALDLLP